MEKLSPITVSAPLVIATYATALERHVEAFASMASVRTLWLYTWTAEPLDARLDWQRVGLEMSRGIEVVLMSRRLAD